MTRLVATSVRPLVPGAASTKEHCWLGFGASSRKVRRALGPGLRLPLQTGACSRPEDAATEVCSPAHHRHARHSFTPELSVGRVQRSRVPSMAVQQLAATRTSRAGEAERRTRSPGGISWGKKKKKKGYIW